MPRKFLILFTNVLAVKWVLSQTVYSTAPTCTDATKPSPTIYPVNMSPSSATVTTLPASSVTATASPAIKASPLATTSPSVILTASPIPSSMPKTLGTSAMPLATINAASKPTVTIVSPVSVSTVPAATVGASPMSCATISSKSIPSTTITASPMPRASPTTSTAKAYFLSGPIPEPKVTILTDIPSVIEVKPRLMNPGVIEVSPKTCANFSLVEIKPTASDPYTATAVTTNANLPMTAKKLAQEHMAPTKRLSLACVNDDSFSSATKSPFLPKQLVCPGISEIDSTTPTTGLPRDRINNPIEFDGLLDGFLTCL